MDLINLDEKFGKEEVRKFEFLSLPNNKEEFVNDVEKIYFQLARYAKKRSFSY
jgi:hypothetical protein